MSKELSNRKGISLEDAYNKNQWAIIDIDKLPENCPVIAVTEYVSKSTAQFFLAEKVLVPLTDLHTTEELEEKVNAARREGWIKTIDREPTGEDSFKGVVMAYNERTKTIGRVALMYIKKGSPYSYWTPFPPVPSLSTKEGTTQTDPGEKNFI